MMLLSPAADRQRSALVRYYFKLGRGEAIEGLAAVLERASARFETGRGLFYDAPRPYPGLCRAGWRWTKEGRYWIAFGAGSGVILAIYYDSSNIPGRIPRNGAR